VPSGAWLTGTLCTARTDGLFEACGEVCRTTGGRSLFARGCAGAGFICDGGAADDFAWAEARGGLLRGVVGVSAAPSIVACFGSSFCGAVLGAEPAPIIVAFICGDGPARPSVGAAAFGATLPPCFALGERLLRVAAAGMPKRGEVIPAADATTSACSVGRWALMFAGGSDFNSGAVIIIVPWKRPARGFFSALRSCLPQLEQAASSGVTAFPHSGQNAMNHQLRLSA
jgi:hypothetical protein